MTFYDVAGASFATSNRTLFQLGELSAQAPDLTPLGEGQLLPSRSTL
jgi:hypothetical protein